MRRAFLTRGPSLAYRRVIGDTPKSPLTKFGNVKTVVGNSIKRLEDPRLLTGGGRYVDDVVRPHVAHAGIVRSAHPHARLERLDLGRALSHPRVLGGVTRAD